MFMEPDKRCALASALMLGAILVAVPVHAGPIPDALGATASIAYDTANSFSDTPDASHAGTMTLSVAGVESFTTFSNGTTVGLNPLEAPLSDEGDGVSIQGAGGAADVSELLAGVDFVITLTNASLTETYSVTLGIAFSNNVDSGDLDSYTHSEFTIDQGGAEQFYTDVQSDVLFGDELNGVPQPTFGEPVQDVGRSLLVLNLSPGDATVLEGAWTMEAGSYMTGDQALGNFAATVTIEGVSPMDPILHWKLDEGAGSTTREEISGETNVATFTGTVSWVSGIAPDGGNAVDVGIDIPPGYITAGTLTQTGAYVVGSPPDYAVLSEQWSMTAWVNLADPQADSGDRAIVSGQGALPEGGWAFLVQNAGGLEQNLTFAVSSVGRADTSINLPLATPVFVAIVADNSGTAFSGGNRHRFVTWDGSSWRFDEGDGYSDIPLQVMAIGAFPAGDAQFHGVVDDVRVFGEALSQDDIDLLTLADTDRDGTPDYLDDDDDNDGLSDAEEAAAGTDSKNPDTDGDGMSDGDEIVAGTDPLDPADFFMITGIDVKGADVTLRWHSASNREYSVFMVTNLLGSTTNTLETGVPATPPMNVHTTTPPTGDQQFYRLGVELP